MLKSEDKQKLNDADIEEIIKRIKPTIEYGLFQTTSENRDDLRQHLYEISIKTLKRVRMTEPKGLFI